MILRRSSFLCRRELTAVPLKHRVEFRTVGGQGRLELGDPLLNRISLRVCFVKLLVNLGMSPSKRLESLARVALEGGRRVTE
ncbi:MAG: hypothetical protein KatS3mg012_2245 [Gaiellaceae bacterium]|nr:MAG: hypothetical protein KatS3mg012_2245 [Gaiellaceae bacterium]